jgi:hypothetical protein
VSVPPPVAPGPSEPLDTPPIGKGVGCIIGGAALAAAAFLVLMAGSVFGPLAAVTAMAAIAGLIYLGLKVPGVWLGFGATLAVGAVVFGACVALINSMY